MESKNENEMYEYLYVSIDVVAELAEIYEY
jgi:hypothetical protein